MLGGITFFQRFRRFLLARPRDASTPWVETIARTTFARKTFAHKAFAHKDICLDGHFPIRRLPIRLCLELHFPIITLFSGTSVSIDISRYYLRVNKLHSES
jgi:hypothetical protein